MLGVIHFDKAKMRTDEDGNVELVLSVSRDSKYNVKPLLETIRSKGKDVTATFNWRTSKRTLDQNALMWALLTLYADAMNGGRKGDITPEDVYMRMLAKYGIADFYMALPQAEESLKKVYRVVRKVDTRDYNGVEMCVFKCYLGSSKYDTKEMSVVIDGIFDELALIGIDAETSIEVSEYYKEWRQFNER